MFIEQTNLEKYEAHWSVQKPAGSTCNVVIVVVVLESMALNRTVVKGWVRLFRVGYFDTQDDSCEIVVGSRLDDVHGGKEGNIEEEKYVPDYPWFGLQTLASVLVVVVGDKC